jgi:uncharacterized protein
MDKKFDLNHLNVKAFARESLSLLGQQSITHFARLAELAVNLEEASPNDSSKPSQISWSIQGEWVPVAGGDAQIWLHLKAELELPMQCQRCMGGVNVSVAANQSFRFVPDEATAESEDDESEEDLLVLTPDLNVWELIEDELIMSAPIVPKHPICPNLVPMSAVDHAFEVALDARPNPFAALAKLKKKPNESPR